MSVEVGEHTVSAMLGVVIVTQRLMNRGRRGMQIKGPNWKRIEKLRDHLKAMRQTEHRKFDMSDWIQSLTPGREEATVGELRKNGKECGSAACLAGETVIQFSPVKAVVRMGWLDASVDSVEVGGLAREMLSLSIVESDWMFSGEWINGGYDLAAITKAQAIRYLSKVLKERDVMVTI